MSGSIERIWNWIELFIRHLISSNMGIWVITGNHVPQVFWTWHLSYFVVDLKISSSATICFASEMWLLMHNRSFNTSIVLVPPTHTPDQFVSSSINWRNVFYLWCNRAHLKLKKIMKRNFGNVGFWRKSHQPVLEKRGFIGSPARGGGEADEIIN